jgi:Zn-dependent protease with chaperone function
VNFFERQRAAKAVSARLIVLFALCVLCMVVAIDLVVFLLLHNAPVGTLVGWLIATTAFTLVLIGGGTLSKTMQLRAGGAAVAQSVGAVAVDPTTTDPQLKRLINIVEEMSLASGVPMPRLFVLNNEPGINAFAAGFSPADAAITVTAGAMQQLNRDELQGVIGHEFSHILNGDMRVNIRLIGLLNGILLLALVGSRVLMWGSFSGGRRSNDKDNSGAFILVIALAMMILGFIGQFFASLIKAAVSRQREWLADASSIQFTRNPIGLAGALKKIAAVEDGSKLRDRAAATEVSHMLFGEGGHSLSSLFATHPPLLERIRALEPDFNPDELATIDTTPQVASTAPAEQVTGLAGGGVAGMSAPAAAPATPSPSSASPINRSPINRSPISPATVAAQVATVGPEHVEYGKELSRQIPQDIRALASQQSTAVPLVLAMLLSDDASGRDADVQVIAQHLGPQTAQAAVALADDIAGLPEQLLLPLLSIASPVLVTRPPTDLDALQRALDAVAQRDATVTLFEYCLTRLVASYIRDADAPRRRSKPGSAPGRAARQAAALLLGAIAQTGNDDPAQAQRAFAAALTTLSGQPNDGRDYTVMAGKLQSGWSVLDSAWPELDALEPRSKQLLVEAMVAAVRDDGQLTLREAELLRTSCALLHCPLPAFVA